MAVDLAVRGGVFEHLFGLVMGLKELDIRDERCSSSEIGVEWNRKSKSVNVPW